MSIRGVRQLTGLKLRYCDLGGSSRGARSFIQEELIEWATNNPAVQVETIIKRNKHPVLIGQYIWGEEKVINVENEGIEAIYKVAQRLRNSSGRKMTRLKVPVKSNAPSIQGVWSPHVPLQTIEFELEHQEE